MNAFADLVPVGSWKETLFWLDNSALVLIIEFELEHLENFNSFLAFVRSSYEAELYTQKKLGFGYGFG